MYGKDLRTSSRIWAAVTWPPAWRTQPRMRMRCGVTRWPAARSTAAVSDSQLIARPNLRSSVNQGKQYEGPASQSRRGGSYTDLVARAHPGANPAETVIRGGSRLFGQAYRGADAILDRGQRQA